LSIFDFISKGDMIISNEDDDDEDWSLQHHQL
jgi:hypothetical protein